MNTQHLSDEAVAAFADGVLAGHARERASRHAIACAECAYAVAVQREAVWALRAATAPALPSGLLDRLRDVPGSTAVNPVPSALGRSGSAMFAAFGSMAGPVGAAALIAAPSARARKARPMALAAAAVVVAGAVVVGSAGPADGKQSVPSTSVPSGVPAAGFVPAPDGAAIVPADVAHPLGR